VVVPDTVCCTGDNYSMSQQVCLLLIAQQCGSLGDADRPEDRRPLGPSVVDVPAQHWSSSVSWSCLHPRAGRVGKESASPLAEGGFFDHAARLRGFEDLTVAEVDRDVMNAGGVAGGGPDRQVTGLGLLDRDVFAGVVLLGANPG